MDRPIHRIIELNRRPKSSTIKVEPEFQVKEAISGKRNKFNSWDKRRDQGERKRILKNDKWNKKYIATGARSSMGIVQWQNKIQKGNLSWIWEGTL
jgi:hypothetical protein